MATVPARARLAGRYAFAHGLAVVLVGLWIAFLLSTHLGTTPGLHGDEAWFGMRAWRIATGRSGSIHGMNGYTGAAFPFLVSLVFRVTGPSVLALRAPGVALNAAGLTLLATMARRLGGPRAALSFVVLAAASLMATSELRVAWEVSALNPLLASVLALTSVAWLSDDPDRPPSERGLRIRCLLLLAASSLGVFSHFIFLVFCIGMFLATLLCACRHARVPTAQLLVAQSATLANAGLLAAIKLLLFRAGIEGTGVAWLYAGLLAVQAFALGKALSATRLTARVLDGLARFGRPLLWTLRAALIAGTVAFAVEHGLAFAAAIENEALIERMYSVVPPETLVILSHAFLGLLLGLWGRGVLSAVRAGALGPAETFVHVLPLASAAALPLFIEANAIRHYILIAIPLLVSAALSAGRLRARAWGVATAGLAVYAGVLSAFVLPIVQDPRHYEAVSSLRFRLGHSVETSAHFLPTTAIVDRMRADGVATVETPDPFFLRGPIAFEALGEPWVAVPDTVATIRYDDAVPGGIRYEVDRPGSSVAR